LRAGYRRGLAKKPEIAGGQLVFQDGLAVRGNIVVELAVRRRQQGARQQSLANLARPTDEDHLVRQVGSDRGVQVAPGGRCDCEV